MKLNEFRAWLEGYEENFGLSFSRSIDGMIKRPSCDQWQAIKAKLATVEVEKPRPDFTWPSGQPSWSWWNTDGPGYENVQPATVVMKDGIPTQVEPRWPGDTAATAIIQSGYSGRQPAPRPPADEEDT